MTFDDALETVIAQNLALTHLLENVVLPTLRDTAPEAFKRQLDAEAERVEGVIGRGDPETRQERIFLDAAKNELSLLRSAFDRP